MRSPSRAVPPLLLAACLALTPALARAQRPSEAVGDSAAAAVMMDYLRSHFEDIHEVSMRFHHRDHRLNGLIVLHLRWVGGKLDSCVVSRNDTGEPAFGDALCATLGSWRIPGIAGPFVTDLPLQIRIVGSGDSSFAARGILTGQVRDRSGTPVAHAVLTFTSAAGPDTLRPCTTNREGIFVKTLIPAGTWRVGCSAPGLAPARPLQVRIGQGQHLRRRITLRKSD